mmetsp:Transcript_31440/g.90803  ORF Transcript_31440/g.90803 Transcript_31440/m.90803 type:complete len:103 (+) Transcript_31440:334-642(+)
MHAPGCCWVFSALAQRKPLAHPQLASSAISPARVLQSLPKVRYLDLQVLCAAVERCLCQQAWPALVQLGQRLWPSLLRHNLQASIPCSSQSVSWAQQLRQQE